MAERTLNMEMGNLICRFGSDHVLLDLAEEVVLPAFLAENQVRSYGSTRYFFHDVKPVLLDNGADKVVGIIGRFIKDTTLAREQIFVEDKGLVRDSESIRSSPSSIFLLILNNHRLIYVKETKDAPPKDAFKSTLLDFLRESHERFINETFENHKAERDENPALERVTKKDLRAKFPRPSLELIPLTSEESIEEFVRKYKILKTIEIALSDRNDENDNDPFFDLMQKRKDDIGSAKSVLKHSNPEGLDKDVAITEIAEATSQGNQEVKLVGEDEGGDTLRGNNEKFQLRKPLDNLGDSLPEAANDLYVTFSSLVQDGLVKLPEVSDKARRLTNLIARKLFP